MEEVQRLTEELLKECAGNECIVRTKSNRIHMGMLFIKLSPSGRHIKYRILRTGEEDTWKTVSEIMSNYELIEIIKEPKKSEDTKNEKSKGSRKK